MQKKIYFQEYQSFQGATKRYLKLSYVRCSKVECLFQTTTFIYKKTCNNLFRRKLDQFNTTYVVTSTTVDAMSKELQLELLPDRQTYSLKFCL